MPLAVVTINVFLAFSSPSPFSPTRMVKSCCFCSLLRIEGQRERKGRRNLVCGLLPRVQHGHTAIGVPDDKTTRPPPPSTNDKYAVELALAKNT